MMKDRKKHKQDIGTEVYKTLHCLDGLKSVKSSPFFYTRLMRRLNELEAQEHQPLMNFLYMKILRPGFVPVLVAASILVGILIGYRETSTIRSKNLKTFVEIYNLSGPNLNDYILTVAN